MKNLYILVTLAHVWIHQVACQCNDGWVQNQNYCYFITKTTEESYTWHTARSWCMENGGDLASIDTIEEQNFIVSQAQENGYDGEVWIGLNQLQNKEANYVWSDGTTGTYTYYAQGQPIQEHGMQQCIYTRTKPHAGDCFTRYDGRSTIQGIIENPEDATPPDTFHFGSKSEDEEGIEFCKEECGKEDQCHSYTFVSTLSSDSVWKGQCVGRSDAYDVDVQDIWSYSGSRVPCYNREDSGLWYSHNCGVTKGLVCKKSPDSNIPITAPPTQSVDSYCPEGYYSFNNNNKCYKVMSFKNDMSELGKTWDEALQYCRDGPGINPDIASIDSYYENAVVLAAIQGYLPSVWIGLHVDERTSSFVWADNSHTGYTNWAPNYPVQKDNVCVEMSVSSYDNPGTWKDVSCSNKIGYVCQTYKDAANPNPSPPLTTPISCKDGWIPYWYACYRLDDSVQKTWSDAEASCVEQGGHIVSIHSEIENSAVYAFAASTRYPIWLGLHKLTGFYEWTDDWATNYLNWRAGSPDDGSGDCVEMMTTGEWQNIYCENVQRYMCKYSEDTSLTTPAHENGNCPSTDWVHWGKHCYHFDIGDTVYTWQEARDQCQAWSNSNYTVDLVSIHSVTENEMVIRELTNKGNSGGPAWIGLKKNNSEATFYWSDGSSTNYYLWSPDEPNNEHMCTSLLHAEYKGAWETRECGDGMAYICKTEKVLIGDSTTTPNVAKDKACCNAWQVIGITIGSLAILAFLSMVGFVTYRYFIQPHKPGGTGLSPLDRLHFRNPLSSRNRENPYDNNSTQIYDDLNEEYMATDVDPKIVHKTLHPPNGDFGVNSGIPSGLSNINTGSNNNDGILSVNSEA